MKSKKSKKQNKATPVFVPPENIRSFTDKQEMLEYLNFNRWVHGYAVAELITKKEIQ